MDQKAHNYSTQPTQLRAQVLSFTYTLISHNAASSNECVIKSIKFSHADPHPPQHHIHQVVLKLWLIKYIAIKVMWGEMVVIAKHESYLVILSPTDTMWQLQEWRG